MAFEREVKEVLGVEETHIAEIGVFPAPPTDVRREHHFRERPLRVQEEGDLDNEMKMLIGQGRNVSVEPRVNAFLPAGRAVRLDADPRVLILEDIPEPAKTVGHVTRIDARHWVLDSRGEEPAGLVLEAKGKRLAFLALHDEVRLFELRPNP